MNGIFFCSFLLILSAHRGLYIERTPLGWSGKVTSARSDSATSTTTLIDNLLEPALIFWNLL